MPKVGSVGGDGWNDVIPLDTGKFACRWHHGGDVLLVGCDHPTEAAAFYHCYTAALAREAIQPEGVHHDTDH